MIKRFESPPVDLEYEKIESVQEGYIEFHENYVFFLNSFICDTPVDKEDKALGNHIIKRYFKMCALKSKISGVELHFFDKPKCYCVYINIMGAADEIKCYFKKHSEANALFMFVLNDYLLNDPK